MFEWATFVSANWERLLAALVLVLAWQVWFGRVCYLKGVRDHGCTAKVSERFSIRSRTGQ